MQPVSINTVSETLKCTRLHPSVGILFLFSFQPYLPQKQVTRREKDSKENWILKEIDGQTGETGVEDLGIPKTCIVHFTMLEG